MQTADGVDAAEEPAWKAILKDLLRGFARQYHAEAATLATRIIAETFSKDSGLSNDVIVLAHDYLRP